MGVTLRARAALATLALTQLNYDASQPRDGDGQWTDGSPGAAGEWSLGGAGITSNDEYHSLYGDVIDERSIDLGDGASLTARFFESGDAHVVIDLPGDRFQVLEEMMPDTMRALANDIEEMVDFDEDRPPDNEGLVADIDSSQHDFYVGRYETGDIRFQPGGVDSEDYLDLSEDDAAALVEALRELADSYEEEIE